MLQSSAENIENSYKKNNIKLKGLKEGLEGSDLISYLVDLFTASAGLDCELVISISAANHIGFH